MLQRALGSGWGVVVPGVLIAALGYAGVSADVWRALVTVGMLMSAAMIWHRQLRHFILLPSCVALIGGIMLMIQFRHLRPVRAISLWIMVRGGGLEPPRP
ncbi:conserved membrane hypothetical protein [Klebsiella variicola]|nr:conserved membrane hypothetical protein [Klebsiella variicola]